MTPNEILSNAEDQDRGRWFSLLHPVTGKAVGIALLVAGPDSRRAAEAAALLVDDLAEAADDTGRVSGAARAEAHSRMLARLCLGWDAIEDGSEIPFSFDRIKRLLAVAWVKSQLDSFAASRSPYFLGAEDAAA